MASCFGLESAFAVEPFAVPEEVQGTSKIADDTLIAVSRKIKEAHLTERPDGCLAYRFDSTSLKRVYLVEVRENHVRPECGGDPQTQPLMFTVKLDRHTHRMYADVGTPGVFRRLP